MKARYCLLLILACHLYGRTAAQQPPSQAEIAKMMKAAQAKLDSMKKTHPELANYKLPGVNAPTQQPVPTAADARNAAAQKMQQLQASLNKTKAQMQQVLTSQTSQYLPVKKAGIDASGITTPAAQAVITLAKTNLQIVNTKLDPVTRSQLDKVVFDTTVDAAGTGILLMVNGLPKWTGEYLICKAVSRDPKNVWAVNDLGVVFRNDKQYKNAIQCFLYAQQLNPQSVVYKTNLGWACSYYGDFNSAKKYFNDVLAVSPGFSSALEGLALIAYQQGDIAALFQCLAKEVTGFGGGGPGPSSDFVSVCGGAQMQQQMDNAGKQQNSDPNDDHTYDQDGDNNDSGDDPPPLDGDEPITYPSYKRVFVNDGNQLFEAAPECVKAIKSAADEFNRGAALLKQKFSTLPRLVPETYTDEYGDKITPYDYSKFYALFNSVHQQFEARVDWWIGKLDTRLNAYVSPIVTKDADLLVNYGKALAACNSNSECAKQVQCEWYPRLHTTKNDDLEGLARLWNEYYDHIMAATVWYSNASSPFLKRIRDTHWNEYANLVREWDVRRAILTAYNRWFTGIIAIQGSVSGVIKGDELDCRVKLAGVEGSDPFSKKHGKLKTFAGPCYTEPTDVDLVFLEYENNCDHTKVSVKSGPFKGYVEKNYSKKFKEDDYWQTGVSVGIEKGVSYGQKAGDWSASIGAKVSAEVGVFARYDSDLNLTARGVDVDLAAEASGGVKTGNAAVDQVNPIHFKTGVDVHIEVVAGQDGSMQSTINATKQ
ncbi:MAG TPA: tetratricopeptide repeat protein [Chitinophagaceae bacterium]